ncbi:MAG: glycosyl hydrolase family 43 [Sphingobacteriales bacterium]|nr:glycosyl hydrolase family 43 [Sphingobacteriales bacterium]
MLKIADFKQLNFKLYSDTPLIYPPRLTPLVADPTVLTPDESPDKRWHLFAHTIYGIFQYECDDGVQWIRHKKRIVRAALRPFIFKENNTYYLFYEKYTGLKLLFSFLPKQRWFSRIEMVSSKDLVHWSAPVNIIRPSQAFHEDVQLGRAVGNPCLIKINDTYRLYFSCSLVRVPDCGFNEPLHITYAESKSIDKEFDSANQPVLSPNPEMRWSNLGAGSMKVIPCEDGYLAFQNGIYEHNGVSGSAICILHSTDGIHWDYLREEPILQPRADIPWMASHIYACDVKILNDKVYLYFNARNHAHWSKGSEKIGLAVADIGH